MKTGNILLGICAFFAVNTSAQHHIRIFDNILFYDGYAAVSQEPVPTGVIRHRNDLYATKLTEQQLASIGDDLVLNVTIKASCDNYDRIGNVNLALVPRGAAGYDPDSVSRIEVGRFITPFMNKNIMPDTVPYRFSVPNVAMLLRDAGIRSKYDIWAELEVFGVPYAAQKEVPGCSGRIDVFYGSVMIETNMPQPEENNNVLLPLSFKKRFNNYDSTATDEVGKTERTFTFTLPDNLTDAALFLITSNHGSNNGGEEYNRRNHFVYFDDSLVHQYKPGSTTCEPFRRYNTQGNGIYGPAPKTDVQWQSFSNWCPGDVIPIRRISLGALEAGTHTFRITVPDARFNEKKGDIPLSLYLHGKTSGHLSVTDISSPVIRILPNPASDKVYIQAPLPVSVSVHSMDGRVVATQDHAEAITVQDLPEGIYMIRVQDSRGIPVKVEKLLKYNR